MAAATHHQRAPSQDVEGLAKSLCHRDDNPALFEQALVIANNELVLRAISAQQLAFVERLREPSARALAKGDNSLKLARARSRRAHEPCEHMALLRDILLEKYKDKLPPPILPEDMMSEIDCLFPRHLAEFLEERENKVA